MYVPDSRFKVIQRSESLANFYNDRCVIYMNGLELKN